MNLHATPTVRLVLLVVAVILLVIFGMAGFGWLTVAHPDGFLGFGLACLAAAHL